jgi:hypothetical protein
VEVLTAYSHTTKLADLQRCINDCRAAVVPVATPASKRPWSLRDRLDDRTLAEMIDAYRAGATAASLAAEHGLSLRSIKRLLAAAGIRRKQLPALTGTVIAPRTPGSRHEGTQRPARRSSPLRTTHLLTDFTQRDLRGRRCDGGSA